MTKAYLMSYLYLRGIHLAHAINETVRCVFCNIVFADSVPFFLKMLFTIFTRGILLFNHKIIITRRSG